MKKTYSLGIWGIIPLVLITCLFLNEMRDWAKDNFLEFTSGSVAAASEAQTELITGFVLEPEQNNARLIQVQDLKLIGLNNHQLSISFNLTNAGIFNQYPALKIISFDHNHQALGQTVFGNSDYVHGTKFRSEVINLRFNFPAGATNIEVSPFYQM